VAYGEKAVRVISPTGEGASRAGIAADSRRAISKSKARVVGKNAAISRNR
jgi:hypothetical protein